MSYGGLTRWLSVNRLDISLAKIGILCSALLLGLRSLKSQAFLVVIPVAAGAGSFIYLYARPVGATQSHESTFTLPTIPENLTGYLPSVVFVGLAAFVIGIWSVGSRTDAIFLLTGGIGVVIFSQILFSPDGHIMPELVLFEIIVAALVLRLGALYVTPGYVGVDIWTHATVFVDGIAQTGSISPLADSKYLMAPFYHVIGAIGSLFFGSARAGIYLTIGVVLPLSLLFVYATCRMLVPARWALLATALVGFSDQFIRWSMHIIPTSLGLVFFLAVVYGVTRLLYADAERWVIGLLVASSLAIVFTHQVSTAIVLIFLGIATFVILTTVLTDISQTPSEGIRKARALSGVFIVTLVTTLVSWSNTEFSGEETFLSREMAVLREATTENAGFLNLASDGPEAAESIGGPMGSGPVAEFVPYIELFGFGLLLLAAVLGGLYLLRGDRAPDVSLTQLLTGAGLFVIVFGLSIFGIRAFLPGRWLAFLYVSMAILGAIGLYAISESATPRLTLVVFVLVAMGYPTTMAVAEKATLENPAFENQHKRFAHTEAEIAAVDSITRLHPPASDATIGTDHPYVSLFRRYGGYGSSASILGLGKDGPDATQASVYRNYQSSGPVTFHRSDASPVDTLPENVDMAVCPSEYNIGYANDQVKLCTPTTVASGGET